MTYLPQFPPKHIVAAVDIDPTADRELADRLVDDACSLASCFRARLTLVHIAVPVTPPVIAIPDLVGPAYRAMCDVVEARTAFSARGLKELENRGRDANVVMASRMITAAGSVPELLVDFARTEEADMLVLTTHGRRGLARLLLGSVAERTAHLAHLPVLLLPPQ